MVVLALDPGLTMGAAKNDNGDIHTCVVKEHQHQWLADNIRFADVIVVEQFKPFGTTIDKYGLYTVELVGAICALAHYFGVKCIRHMPGDRKPMQQRAHDHLKGLKTKFMVHEVDALAHLFYYEATGK